MELREVQSSTVDAVGYDNGNLFIKFKTGTYLYENVRPEIYQALLNAPSKGSFIYSMIRNKYKTTKLETNENK